jgi:uncharacterized protein YjbI with pentapeptide repeats
MRTITKEELATILAAHKEWRDSEGATGARANLAYANLARANLADANLAYAYLADANLADAYLADANLAYAYLADANLADAYLADANLAGAYLAGAYLADANLARANLAYANLAGAYLADANLADAYLADANLADAYLAGAYLADANLAYANLAGARNVPTLANASTESREPYERRVRTPAERAAEYRARHPDVPVVEKLDAKILSVLDSGAGTLDMCAWHSCETTHCRAGWAIHLAGKAGYDLEKKLGDPAMAGRAIYRASTGRSPHFYATNAHALADIKRCAEEDALAMKRTR